MQRDIEKYLLEWKDSFKRKPLIIRGARQVGKTYTVDKFGNENFNYYLKINLEKSSLAIDTFKKNDVELLLSELSVLHNTPIIQGETLLFIDEIQLSPEAIATLRYFYEDFPGLHVIAAGSLLDHTLNHLNYSMPVGRLEFAYMYPMSFREFLFAVDEKQLWQYIAEFNFQKEFSNSIHKRIFSLLRLYFFIGGMPEAVDTYIQTKNLLEVEKVHAEILTALQYDFSKYGTKREQVLLMKGLNYCANNVGKKVKYVNIETDASSTQLKQALKKLEMSRIIHIVRKTKSVNVPITQFVDDNTYKTIFLDIGLANHLAGIKLTNLSNLITDFEGSLAEQFVGQEIIASAGYYLDSKLYYWIREAKNSNAEIDFLFQRDNEIFPIEVKAGKSGTLKSLQVFLAENNKNSGVRLNADLPSYGRELEANVTLSKSPQKVTYQLKSFPLYFAFVLKKVI